MNIKVFIDGETGTVGLNIRERLLARSGVELIEVAYESRRDLGERKKAINSADFVFLCLPDGEAVRSVGLIENDSVRVIDASTAHRTSPGWVYGFPEMLPEQSGLIAHSKRVTVPGCYATGFVALVRPLVERGVIPPDYPVCCYAVSGYSGAGKSAIEEYRGAGEKIPAKLYSLGQNHKHLPEMKLHGGLSHTPMFNPIIDNFYSGMTVCVPVVARTLKKSPKTSDLLELYKEYYSGGGNVNAVDYDSVYNVPLMAVNGLQGKEGMEIYVHGDSDNERILLTARFDNLCKGASGAAVQNFDIMRGKV